MPSSFQGVQRREVMEINTYCQDPVTLWHPSAAWMLRAAPPALPRPGRSREGRPWKKSHGKKKKHGRKAVFCQAWQHPKEKCRTVGSSSSHSNAGQSEKGRSWFQTLPKLSPLQSSGTEGEFLINFLYAYVAPQGAWLRSLNKKTKNWALLIKKKINKPLSEERGSIKEMGGTTEGTVQWILGISNFMKETLHSEK